MWQKMEKRGKSFSKEEKSGEGFPRKTNGNPTQIKN